jgi:hypothetical protein
VTAFGLLELSGPKRFSGERSGHMQNGLTFACPKRRMQGLPFEGTMFVVPEQKL